MKTTSQKTQPIEMKKTIKQTVPYNFKKVLAGIMLVAVPVFVACEKDPVKPNNNGGNGGNTQPRETKDIVYDMDINGLDSTMIQSYINQNYDINLTPESKKMFSTLQASRLRKRAARLRGFWGIAPDRISGKKSDTIYVTPEALNAGAASFWIDTLGNTVLPYQNNKQR